MHQINDRSREDAYVGHDSVITPSEYQPPSGPSVDQETPESTLRRPEIALTLSGGGFRATLFHLGVVRFLAETGRLKQVTRICSVSGGSILAAHLVLNWERYTGSMDSLNSVVNELLAFTRRDVRGRILRRWLAACALPIPLLCRLLSILPGLRFFALPGNLGTLRWLLEAEYRYLFREHRLADLGSRTPDGSPRPDLHILAVSLTTGALASFSWRGLWVDEKPRARDIPTGSLLVSLAVTASSAFPPLFPPVRVDRTLLTAQQSDFPTVHYLADGGIYDNLGFHRLKILEKQQGFSVDTVVVSDAGARADWATEGSFTLPLNRNVRATDLLMSRIGELDHEALRAPLWPKTVVVSLHDSVNLSDDASALPPETQRSLASVRTDLDKFSEREIHLLTTQGYAVARRRLCGLPGGKHTPAGVAESGTIHPPSRKQSPPGYDSPLSKSHRLRRRLVSLDWPTGITAVAALLYLWLVYVYAVEPVLARWRLQEYDSARSIGSELGRAKTPGLAAASLARLGSSWSAPIVDTREIRHQRLLLAKLIDEWKDTGTRPVGFDVQILRLGQSYGRAWSKDTSAVAQKLLQDFRMLLYDQAADVTRSIAAYAILGSNPEEDQRKFWALYWGDLSIVESREIEGAMVAFGDVFSDASKILSAQKDSPSYRMVRGIIARELVWRAAGVAHAIETELGRPGTGAPHGFYLGGPTWVLLREGLWVESRGTLDTRLYSVVSRGYLRNDDCLGTFVADMAEIPPRGLVFIPDRDCVPRRVAYRSKYDSAWQDVNREMEDVF